MFAKETVKGNKSSGINGVSAPRNQRNFHLGLCFNYNLIH